MMIAATRTQDVALAVPSWTLRSMVPLLPGLALAALVWRFDADPGHRSVTLWALGAALALGVTRYLVVRGGTLVIHSHYARRADGTPPAVTLRDRYRSRTVPAPANALVRRGRSGAVREVYIVATGPGAGPRSVRVRCGWSGAGRLTRALRDAGIGVQDLGWVQRWEVAARFDAVRPADLPLVVTGLAWIPSWVFVADLMRLP